MGVRSKALAAAGALALSAGVLIPVQAAMAATCSSNPAPSTPSLRTDGQVAWSAAGTCTGASALRADLMHYYAPPIGDALVNYAIDNSASSSHTWSASAYQCDSGGSTTYYTRAYWIYSGTDGTKVNSARKTINNHC